MSNQFWADACLGAIKSFGTSSAMAWQYGSHAFAIACFVCSTAFSGLWLFRWHAVKRSNCELLLSVWRFLGRFLCLSFFCGVFGTAAWVTKIAQISYKISNLRVTATANNTVITCQENLSFLIPLTQSQAAFRIFYSLEVVCLFLYIIFGLDRISEQAQSAKSLSKNTAPTLRDVPSEPKKQSQLWVPMNDSVRSSRRSGVIRAQQELLLPTAASRSSSAGSSGSSQAKFSRTRVLQLLFKSGLAFVALCFIGALVSIITVASIQARISSLYKSAYDDCNPDGTSSQASESSMRSATSENISLISPIFAGFVTEFAAAIVVILLYVAGGCLGVSIVGTARRTIESSRVKLRQLQVTIGNQHDAKAASAVSNALQDAIVIANAKMRRLVVFYCIVVFLFGIRAAYAGLLTYASSQIENDCGSLCDACQPIPVIMYEWFGYSQQYPAIFSAFSSAMLTVVSVWFMLTADEKHLLRTGQLKTMEVSLEGRVQMTLHEQVGLHQLL